MIRENRDILTDCCCLCGKTLLSTDNFSNGIIRKIDKYDWKNVKVKFCDNCAEGLKLIDFDEKNSLNGTIAGQFVSIDNDGLITLKTMNGLNEQMTKSMVNSVIKGLQNNPLANGFGHTISVNTKNFKFEVQTYIDDVEKSQDMLLHNIFKFAALEEYNHITCPFCNNPIRFMENPDVIELDAFTTGIDNNYLDSKNLYLGCGGKCFRFNVDDMLKYFKSKVVVKDSYFGYPNDVYKGYGDIWERGDIFVLMNSFIKARFREIFATNKGSKSQHIMDIEYDTGNLTYSKEKINKVKENFICGQGCESDIYNVFDWWRKLLKPYYSIKEYDRFNADSFEYKVRYNPFSWTDLDVPDPWAEETRQLFIKHNKFVAKQIHSIS